jgi:sarcosine oxidase subunit beta
MGAEMQLVIVGGGAVGLCAAVALAERGVAVKLIERHLPGAANSTLTGGGIRQQFGTEANIALSVLAQPWWDGFAERFGVDPLLRRIGYLFLARSGTVADGLRANIAIQAAHGVESHFLDEDELIRRWPSLNKRGFVAGSFRRDDGWANQQRIVDGLYRGCLARNVDLRVGTECLGIEMTGGRVTGVTTTDGVIGADAVLLASGAWGLDLLAATGHILPVTAHRHELLVVETSDTFPSGLPWLIDVEGQVHLRSDVSRRALVGGFLGRDDAVDPDSYAPREDRAWAKTVLNAASRAFGAIDSDARICRGWAGLYPSTPDRHPIIDRLAEGLYVAMGFSGAGLMHSPAAALLATELILGETVAPGLARALSVARFSTENAAMEQTGF